MVHQAHALVVDVLVEIALVREGPGHAHPAPRGPVVLRDEHVAVGAEALERVAEMRRPGARVAHLGAAERQQVVHRLGGVLSQIQHPLLRQEEVQFGWRLGVGRELEHHRHAVDDARLEGLGDRGGGRDDRAPGRAETVDLAETGVDRAARTAGQGRAELVGGAAAHGVAGDHRLGDHGAHESGRRHDHHAPGGHLDRIDDAARAAVVIAVAVRVDYRRDRTLRPVREVQVERRLRRPHRAERVDHDHAGRAFDEGDVGQREAAHLVDTGHDLEQAVDGVEPRQPPQARVYRVGRGLGVEEGVASRPLGFGKRSDETAARVVEVLPVAEGQRAERGLVHGPHRRLDRLGRRCLTASSHRGREDETSHRGHQARVRAHVHLRGARYYGAAVTLRRPAARIALGLPRMNLTSQIRPGQILTCSPKASEEKRLIDAMLLAVPR